MSGGGCLKRRRSNKESSMSEFVFLFRATEAEQREAMGTPEHAQRSMQAMLAWFRALEANGHLKNPGQPLEPTGRVVRGPNAVVTDGPYVEAKDMVLGFTIIEARDVAEAVQLASGCPMVTGGAVVEIRPVAQSRVLNESGE
jgi:hypothetical protein